MKKTIKVELKWNDSEFVNSLAKEIKTEFKIDALAGLNRFVYVTVNMEFKKMSKLLSWLESKSEFRCKEITVVASY